MGFAMPDKTPRPVRAPDLRKWKASGRKIAMLTAYDALTAKLLERAGVDVLLVGDSLGMVALGYETTVPVSLGDMVHHSRAVSAAVRRPLVVADMPFMSYQAGIDRAVGAAGRLIQEGGAAAVKLEGGRPSLAVVRRLTEIGIPVMGHLGLTPQSFHQLGGFRRQARDEASAEELLADARELEQAGAFAVVLEAIPASVARRTTEAIKIPTIGIGAGPGCDGQVLVTEDMLGSTDQPPPFVKRYAELGAETIRAVEQYVGDVRKSRLLEPGPEPE